MGRLGNLHYRRSGFLTRLSQAVQHDSVFGFSFSSRITISIQAGIVFLTFGVKSSLNVVTSKTSMAKITISCGIDRPSFLPRSRAVTKLTSWGEAA